VIKIKNTKIFTVNKSCKYHWSKLPKFIEFMENNVLNLEGANLSYADLEDINLEDVNLEDTNLSYANLSYANLEGANLSYANLSYANLEGANLSYANLEGSNLMGAKLEGVNLWYANLKGVSFKTIKYFYNQNISRIKTDHKIYQQSLIGSVGRTITYIPSLNVCWCGCRKGTKKEILKAVDDKYPIEHPINKEYRAIFKHFDNLEKIRNEK